MDKIKLKQMMTEMAALGAKYGYIVTANGGTITETDAKIKFVVKDLVINEDGKAVAVVTARAKTEAQYLGIDISQSFTVQGVSHKVTDFHPRKYKQPWITTASNGKNYKWSNEQLRLRLTMEKAQAPKKDGLAHLVA